MGGGYRSSLFSEEDGPMRKRVREGMLGDIKLNLDPGLQAAMRYWELTGEMPPLSMFGPEKDSKAPAGGWGFDPLRPKGFTFPPSPIISLPGERPPWTMPPPKAEEKKEPSLRERAKDAGLPGGMVDLFTPPPDVAEPLPPERLDPAGVGPSAKDEAARKKEMERQYKERTGKQPFDFMIKFNVDEKGRFWFGL